MQNEERNLRSAMIVGTVGIVGIVGIVAIVGIVDFVDIVDASSYVLHRKKQAGYVSFRSISNLPGERLSRGISPKNEFPPINWNFTP